MTLFFSVLINITQKRLYPEMLLLDVIVLWYELYMKYLIHKISMDVEYVYSEMHDLYVSVQTMTFVIFIVMLFLMKM